MLFIHGILKVIMHLNYFFCKNDEDLDNAIKSLIDEGEDRCHYYTDVNFLFQIGYIDKRGYPSTIIEKHGLGMIKFNNKLIFLDVDYGKNSIPAWEIIEKYGIRLRINDRPKYNKTKKELKYLKFSSLLNMIIHNLNYFYNKF